MTIYGKKDIDEAVTRAGESTHYREHLPESVLAAPRTAGDTFFASKSIRSHQRMKRGGLAGTLTLPIVIALAIGVAAILLVAYFRLARVQEENMLSDAANTAFATSFFGRILITRHSHFLDANPAYPAQAEWQTGKHWLVDEGFVTPEEWRAATGFEMDELAPVSVLEQAGDDTILSDLTNYINAADSKSEIVAVYIMDSADNLLAASRRANFRFDPLSLRTIPLPEEYIDAGGSRIHIDSLPDASPVPLARGVARIMDHTDPERQLGLAAVILRNRRHANDLFSFMILLAGLGAVLAAVVALAAWHTARLRLTQPLRRFALDMQAIADGDYSRRAAWREADELGLLSQAFNTMAERLRITQLNAKETSRLESDLAIARDIQNNLLPPQTPRVRGLDMFTTYRPAKEIGGDYYDFLPVDDHHMGLVVADASGKSIPAALVMSTTRAILRFVAPGNTSAAETLTRVNAILSVDIPKGMFVTAYYVILDPLTNSMLCASAGHTALLLARADGSVEMLNPGGIALGFDSGPIFQRSIREQRIKLAADDRVLLYTDGVVECANSAGEEYGDRRLREFVRRQRGLSSHDFVGALLADLERHRGAADIRDDITIVTFKVV